MSGTALEIRAARPGDLPDVLALLAEAGLPAAGVVEHFGSFLVATGGGRVLGAIGVERYPPHGLLRSAVVAPPHRGGGIGRMLVQALLDRSRGDGLTDLWLLTETAEPWFARLGFRREDRSGLPAALGASEELRGACPVTAACLRLRL